MSIIKLGDRPIGEGNPCFLIAEVGTTSLGDLDRAIALVDASAEAGVDSVKFQVIDATQLSESATTFPMQIDGAVHHVNMGEMFRRLEFSQEQWRKIAHHAHQRKLLFFATADYVGGVDLLEEIGVPLHKIGAWDATFWPLIDRIGRTKKPLMVDLGPTTVEEIEKIERWYVRAGGAGPIIYLHDYHTLLPEQMNMRAIEWLIARGKGPVGFSSPNRDCDVDFLSIALGAELIEKRLTLDANDAAFHAHESLTPSELRDWVVRVRAAEAALGKAEIRPSQKDLDDKSRYYRSICALTDIRAGELFTPANLGAKRPGSGIATDQLPRFWGTRAHADISMNTLLDTQ